VINQQVRRTCDDDVDGAARIAGDIAGGARVLARRLGITLAQLDEELVSVDADLHLVVRLERLAVFEPRHAQLRACKSSPPHHHTTTVLRPVIRDHPGEPVPEGNFWTIWCKGRLTEADTPTTRLGTTPSGLTSAHLRIISNE